MDTQSIGPVSGQTTRTPLPQASSRTQNASTVKALEPAGDANKADDADAAPPEKTRERDPRSLQYQIDSATQRIVATIIDESNRIVIRQIPNEEVLRIAAAIDRMKGFLLEGKA